MTNPPAYWTREVDTRFGNFLYLLIKSGNGYTLFAWIQLLPDGGYITNYGDKFPEGSLDKIKTNLIERCVSSLQNDIRGSRERIRSNLEVMEFLLSNESLPTLEK